MDSLIHFNNVYFHYPPREELPAKLVLEDVTLQIKPGEFVAVLGHNGSGKSTLAKHCNAVLLPQDGVVTVAEYDTRDESHWLRIRQTVGMVFQNPDNQIVSTVVEEDVAFALENLGIPSEEIRSRVDDALRTVGMYEYREYAPHRLSGGQKQRIAIAGVIAMRPRCIVLDEPTAMLDPQGRQEVLQTIRQLSSEHGIAVALITHHMSEASHADRVVVMDAGRVLLDAPPREVFRQADTLRGVGLTVPQTTALLCELRTAGENVPDTALTVEECAGHLFRWLHTVDSENPLSSSPEMENPGLR